MQIMPPVLMPIWMVIVMVVGLLLVTAWLLRTFLVTRRDISQEVGDIPMAPRERMDVWMLRGFTNVVSLGTTAACCAPQSASAFGPQASRPPSRLHSA